MKSIDTNILVIGAGASGITAAISAAQKIEQNGINKKVALIEKNDRIGKKILMTGNGKCNLSNENITKDNYNEAANITEPLLNKYNSDFVKEFFEKLGLLTKADSAGRVYPYTNQASSVLDVLRVELKRLNVQIFNNVDVILIKKKKGKFVVISSDFTFTADKVIISVGGLASPGRVFADSMYNIVKKFGHAYENPFPALVPIKTNSGFEKALKGVRWNAKISLLHDDVKIKEAIGEVQFTEYGLSGICIFQLSRFVGEIKKRNRKAKLKIIVDLMPEYSSEEILSILKNKLDFYSNEELNSLFVGILNNKLGQAVIKQCRDLKPSMNLASLTNSQLSDIAAAIKNLEFKITDVQTFKHAQVMSGGFNLNEFNLKTMESLRVKGLYLTGEMLDVDGLCGGFNLHWAWISGFVAGKSAAE